MGKVVLLDSARTTNLRAWLAKVTEENLDASCMAVLSVFEAPDGTDPTCSISYFNMGEMEFTWAAAKMSDAAVAMRGRMGDTEQEDS